MSSKYFILYRSYHMLVFQLLPKCKFMCMTHSEIKQYQNIRIWNKERFIKGHAKEMGGSCLKNSKLPESFQQSPFIEKETEGHV